MIDSFQDYFNDNGTGRVSEAMSRDNFRYMDGLTNIKAMETFLATASAIAEDLFEEGFDLPDIIEYLSTKMTNKVKK